MAITELPEKTADSLGLPLVNIRTPQPNQLSAVHVEAIKDTAIQVTTAVGVDDGSTNGSLRQEIFQAKGSGSAEGGTVAKVPGVGGAFKLLRSGFSVDPPGVEDDSAHGYGIGSLWDQVDSLPPWDGPPTRVLWVCKSDYVGAAEWVEVAAGGALPSDATPQALGTAAAGVSALVSRADHVHATNASNTTPLALATTPSAGVSSGVARVDHVHPIQGPCVEEIAITNGVTLVAGDALALVSGRVSKADARAGSVVPGYVGQCVVGGTGNVGGTVKALVVVGGVAPATGLTPGAPVYLSTSTLGVVSSTEPTGLGALYQRVGFALDATHFAVQVGRPETIDWCSPLDIPTNGIFYGRASSANLLASGRITTNGIADLFGTGRACTVDGAGSAPAFISGGGPGSDAWFFVKAVRADRLRILHDAGMTGVAWSGFAVHLPLSASFSSLLAKANVATSEPFDFGQSGGEAPYLAGELIGTFTKKGWRADGFSRAGTGAAVSLWSRGVNIAEGVGGASSAGTKDLMVGNRDDLGNGFDGRIAAFALWNRALSAAEMVGLAKWARREFML